MAETPERIPTDADLCYRIDKTATRFFRQRYGHHFDAVLAQARSLAAQGFTLTGLHADVLAMAQPHLDYAETLKTRLPREARDRIAYAPSKDAGWPPVPERAP